MVLDGAWADDFGVKYPVTGSHEPAGTIVALGGKVKVGMRGAGLLHAGICRGCIFVHVTQG